MSHCPYQLLVRVLLAPHTCGRHTCGRASAHRPSALQGGPALQSREAGDGISLAAPPPPPPYTPSHTQNGGALQCFLQEGPLLPLHPGKQGMGSALAAPHPTLHPITHSTEGLYSVYEGFQALPLHPGKQGWISSGSAPPPHPTPHHTHRTEGLQRVEACSSLDVGWGVSLCMTHPCTNPSTQHRGAGSELTSSGFPPWGSSPRTSILKTSSTKTIRQSLRESPLRENGPVVDDSAGWSHQRPQKTRHLDMFSEPTNGSDSNYIGRRGFSRAL